MTKFIVISAINLIIILVIFILTASLKKENFIKPMFINVSIFFGIEVLFYVGLVLYRKLKAGRQKTQKKEHSLDEIEIFAEQYMWKREGIKRKDCLNFISEPRAVELSSGITIQAYVWLFKDMVSIKLMPLAMEK